jgi:DNA replication protein DnaC
MEASRTAELKAWSALDAFRDKTFEAFDHRIPGTEKAYREAAAFAKDPTSWLVLVGTYGCGKTHLAAAIANQALKQGNPVLFEVVPDLLDHLRSAFGPSSDIAYDELFERVRTAGLLVLDDLGTENTTPWAREKLYQIINYRYNYRQPTVITSNRRLNDIDDRIRSRMTDAAFCKVVEVTAGDYRQRQPGERRAKDAHRAK